MKINPTGVHGHAARALYRLSLKLPYERSTQFDLRLNLDQILRRFYGDKVVEPYPSSKYRVFSPQTDFFINGNYIAFVGLPPIRRRSDAKSFFYRRCDTGKA